jgi:hypothetical protein
VAASAVGAGLGQGAQVGFGAQAAPSALSTALGQTFGEVGRGTVFGMMSGATASAIGSGRVMARQVAVDAFGNALGNSLVAGRGAPTPGGSGLRTSQEQVEAWGPQYGQYETSRSTDYSLASGEPVRFGTDSVESVPTPEELQASFRQSERDYRRNTEQSVAGSSYVAQNGDGISRAVDSSSPQAIGNFMRANNLTSDRIKVGRNYFVPGSTTAYGDATDLGQFALNQGNERIAAARAASLIAADGMRIGPTVERAQAMGIYSGDGAMTLAAGSTYPEMRAPAFSARQAAVDWVSSVVGTSRAGNVVAGAVDAWLAAPEVLSSLPGTLAAIPSGVVRLANGAMLAATQLRNDPLGTVAEAMASGVDGLRSGFNRTVNGNGFAMGSALYALGTAAVPLGKTDGFLGWPGRGGSGPAAGTIGITDSTSTAALRNYYPRGGGVEFVYDPAVNQFVAGSPLKGLFDGSPHEQLAQSIRARNNPALVGGTFQRGPNGEFFTTENSGHYGHNWNNEVRFQFQQWLSGRVNAPVVHESWRP